MQQLARGLLNRLKCQSQRDDNQIQDAAQSWQAYIIQGLKYIDKKAVNDLAKQE
tara:strand:+ start:141 stop:302 length:162 start_codon:yes stop_codon:yes gene_type:complete